MDNSGDNLLRQADQFLKEGRRESAIPLLAEYLQRHPNSARGWWMLGFAVSDPKKQIECLERVLRIDPQFVPARARLEKLKGDSSRPSVAPFVEGTLPEPAGLIKGTPPNVSQKGLPRKKTRNQFLQFAGLAGLGCAVLGVFGFAGVMAVQGLPGLQSQPISATQMPLPATWTPTPPPTLNLSQDATDAPLATPTIIPSSPTAVIPKSKIGPYKDHYAPDFSLININEDVRVRLSSYEGQAVIIFFWTTWCEFCEAEMPVLQMLYQNYKDLGFVILAVDVGESPFYARSYRDSHAITFPILDDPDKAVSARYNVTSFPTHYFVEKNGVISAIRVGSLDYWGFNKKVREMLGLAP